MSQAYASVTLDSISNNSSAAFNPFASGSHAAYAATPNVAESGVTYTSADGKFTVDATGKWRVYGKVFLENMSGTFPATVTYRIKINGVVEWSAEIGIHAAADPFPYAWKLLLELTAGDFVELEIEETGGGDLARTVDGTTFNIARWA